MRAYADAAREHPTWSVAYAEDVPMLLAEIDRMRALLCRWRDDFDAYPVDPTLEEETIAVVGSRQP